MAIYKKLRFSLVILVLISSILMLVACNKDQTLYNEDGLQFELINDGTAYAVSVGKATKSGNKELVIPSEFKGKPVAAIAAYGFCDNTGRPNGRTNEVTSITIPSSVTMIGRAAFTGCDLLANVTIPSSVTSMGAHAYSSCIYNNTADNNVVYMDQWAVYYKGNIDTVSLREDTVGIADNAFAQCDSLTSIVIPASVKYIGNTTISLVTSETNEEAYATEPSPPEGVFLECVYLESVVFENGSLLEIIGVSAFDFCSNLKSIVIPSGVKVIEKQAFNNCISLESIEIPINVKSIGYRTFGDCQNLENITFTNGSLIENIGAGAFTDCTKLETIVFPASLKSIGASAFAACGGIINMEIPVGITKIDVYAFSSWHNPQTIYVREFSCQADADAAWGEKWRALCSAEIVYLG